MVKVLLKKVQVKCFDKNSSLKFCSGNCFLRLGGNVGKLTCERNKDREILNRAFVGLVFCSYS